MRSHYQIGYRGGIIKRFATRFINLTTATLFFATTFAGAAPVLFGGTATAATQSIRQLAFTTSAQTTTVNQASAVIKVQTQNSGSQEVALDSGAGNGATLTLNSSSSTGQFSDASTNTNTCTGNWGITTLTMSAGTSNKAFCYRDSSTGTFTLTVTSNIQLNNPNESVAPATQDVTVTQGTTPAPTIQPCTTVNTTETTNMSSWDTSDTRATGHFALTPSGLHIWTEGTTSTDKSAGYTTTNFPLKNLGTTNMSDTISYTAISGATAPSSQLVIDFNNDGTPDGILVGEPGVASYGNNFWLSVSSAQAAQSQFAKDSAPHNGGGYGSAWYGTAQEWLTAFPDATVKAIGYSLGSGVKGDFVITKLFAGCTNYTFKSLPVAMPTMPNVSGDVIFNSISSPLPASYPSLGYEATSTSAFGDKITFGGTSRSLNKAAIMLTSWACKKGNWTNGCITTPGATFSQPVTLNIYNAGNNGSVGSLIKTVTQTFDVPYRPTTDPTCSTKTNWRDDNGDCHSGYNYVAVFDLGGITVPNTVIYSVAYNTRHYGTNPVGIDGSYDSLNVGLNSDSSAPYIGTDTVPDEIYWDSTYLGRTAGLTPDTGWSPYQAAALFTANPVDTSAPTVSVISPVASDVLGGLGNGYKTTVKLKIDDPNGVNLNSKYTWVEFYDGATVNGSVSATSQKYSITPVAGTTDEYEAVIDTSSFVSALHSSGTYGLAVRAQDMLGNGSSHKLFTGAPHHGAKLLIDNNRPTVSLTSPANNSYQKSSFAISGTASDPETSISHVNIYIAHNPWAGGGYVVNNQLATYDPVTHSFSLNVNNIPEGTYTVKAFAYDQNGNVQSVGDNITVDTTAPSTPTITAPGARTWHRATPIIDSWTSVATDVNGNTEHLSHYQVAYAYDDGHNFSGSTCLGATIGGINVYCRDASGTSRNHVPGPNEQGGVTIWVRAIDKAGNIGTWSKSVHYYYDHEAPTLANFQVPTGTVGSQFTLSGDIHDNMGFRSVYLQLANRGNSQRYGGITIYPGINDVNPLSTGVNASWVYTYNAKSLNLPDGIYSADAEVTDKAGNSFNTGWSSNFTVDTTAPTAPTNLSWTTTTNVVVPNNGYTNVVDGTASWQNGGSSDVDHYVYKYWNDILGNQWKVGHEYTVTTKSTSLPGVFNQGEGVHHLCVEAVDAAGNTSACTEFTITYDATAPDAPTIKFVEDTTNGTQNVTLADTDATASIYYTLDGTNPTSNSTLYAGAFNLDPRTNPGATIKAIAYDPAGNAGTVTTEAAPAITNEASLTPTTSSIVLQWTTNEPATSRVIYDTVSHATLGTGNNYGYAFSTTEDATLTTDHSVLVNGLTPGTTYYFRFVSHGSPITVSSEITGLTLAPPAPSTPAGTPPTFQATFTTPATTTAPTVLGAQTTIPSSTSTSNNNGQVKGDSTTKPNDKVNNSGSFLGLGWWWLLIVAAVLGLWWLLAARRHADNDK